MTNLPSRRAALGLLASAAAGAALPLACGAPAAAQGFPPLPGILPFPGADAAGRGAPDALRISRFAVDASALRSPFNTENADLLTHDLAGDLRTVFADRVAGAGGRGATLLVRVTSLYLPPWAGGRSGGNGGDGPDNIEGIGFVTAGGRVLSQTPVYTTLDPAYSGAWYLPDINRRRVASISYQLAYWLRREMGI